jgi:hypothetical protein
MSAIRFSQDVSVTTSWANRTGIELLDKEELEAGYARAKDFLLQLAMTLVNDHGWCVDEPDEPDSNVSYYFFCIIRRLTAFQAMIVITSDRKYPNRTGRRRLLLPSSFTSFLDVSMTRTWNVMFADIFNAKRGSDGLFIDSVPPISDIFYLLQTFLPGMLLIYRIDDIDDLEERETICALPRPVWIEEHQDLLQRLFGGKRYDNLLEAARSKAYEINIISSYDSGSYDDDDYYTNIYGQRVELDYQACGLECGYCGTCEY